MSVAQPSPNPGENGEKENAPLTAQQIANLPKIKFAVRSRSRKLGETVAGLHFREAPFQGMQPPVAPKTYPCDAGSSYGGPSGHRLALASTQKIEIFKTEDMTNIFTINRPIVRYGWSPLGNFLLTWERKSPETGKETLILWDIQKQTELLRFNQKEWTVDTWPLQWSDDEALLAYMVTTEIRFYDGHNPTSVLHKAYVPGLVSFSFAPTIRPYTIAVFVPVQGATPARVSIFQYPKFEESQVRASKSFFKADEAYLKWAPNGSAILIKSETNSDTTGKSYYGESNLHLLAVDGSFQGTVPATPPGPVQDFAFSPSSREFLVIRGEQPAKALLYQTATCTPLKDFGSGSRNTIRFSPHGRFLMLGGFGNLAGEMDFWDFFKFKLIGTAIDRDAAKSFEWTADSRCFITAALRPWRNVDNNFKVFSYAGELLYHEKFEELWQVILQPVDPKLNIYPNRPQSPRLTDKRKLAAAGSAPSESSNSSAPSKPNPSLTARVGAYVPPHLRNRPGGGEASQIAARVVTGPKKLTDAEKKAILSQDANNNASGSDNLVSNKPQPGEEGYLTKNQLKNKKKKEKKSKQQEEEEAAAEAAKALEEAKKLASAAELHNDPDLLAKKIKALQKKLRQIDEIKAKKASGGELDEAQIAKLENENELLNEMQSLNQALSNLQVKS